MHNTRARAHTNTHTHTYFILKIYGAVYVCACIILPSTKKSYWCVGYVVRLISELLENDSAVFPIRRNYARVEENGGENSVHNRHNPITIIFHTSFFVSVFFFFSDRSYFIITYIYIFFLLFIIAPTRRSFFFPLRAYTLAIVIAIIARASAAQTFEIRSVSRIV